jgi:hypothetical protein
MTVICCVAMAAPGLADPTSATLNGLIPAGTKLHFHLLAPLRSDRNKAGDTFAFALLDPLVVDGQVVAVQGAIGSGTVLVSGHNGTLGHEGDLTLRLDILRVSDGQAIRFADQELEINGRDRKAESRILGLIPDAGIAAWFIRGKEIAVDPTTPIQTVTLYPATITLNSATPAPMIRSPNSASTAHRM